MSTRQTELGTTSTDVSMTKLPTTIVEESVDIIVRHRSLDLSDIVIRADDLQS
jgi:hypothetical protein